MDYDNINIKMWNARGMENRQASEGVDENQN